MDRSKCTCHALSEPARERERRLQRKECLRERGGRAVLQEVGGGCAGRPAVFGVGVEADKEGRSSSHLRERFQVSGSGPEP